MVLQSTSITQLINLFCKSNLFLDIMKHVWLKLTCEVVNVRHLGWGFLRKTVYDFELESFLLEGQVLDICVGFEHTSMCLWLNNFIGKKNIFNALEKFFSPRVTIEKSAGIQIPWKCEITQSLFKLLNHLLLDHEINVPFPIIIFLNNSLKEILLATLQNTNFGLK